MSSAKKVLASLMLLTAGALIGSAGVANGAGDGGTAAVAPPKYCHVLLSKDRQANGDSVVLTQACSNESNVVAKNQFDRQVAKMGAPASGAQRQSQAMASTALMTWWSNSYQSGSSTVIYGNSGICDSSGYTITPNDWWKNNMSSVVGYSYCNRMIFNNKIFSGWSGQYVSPANYLNNYNDNVGQVKIYCRYLSDCDNPSS